ncbi:MAG: DUF4842 domain-containing protein [Phocaeicola sp.]
MRHFFYLLLLALGSCSTNGKIVEESQIPSTEPTTSARYISIFTDPSCERPIIKNYPLVVDEEKITFPLQYGLNEVYVMYNTPNEAVVTKMAVSDVLSESRSSDPGAQHYFDIYEPTREVKLTYSGTERTPGYMINADGFTSYHCSGVVMFEDTWPSKSNVDGEDTEAGLFFGDYNDLVVDYDLESVVNDAGDNSQFWKEKLKIVLHIRARGGGYAEQLGLKLEGLHQDYIDKDQIEISYSMSNHVEPAEPLTAEVKWDGNYPVIYVNDLKKLTDDSFMSKNGLSVSKANGISYYNTINDELNVTKGLFTVTVTFNGKGDRNAVNNAFKHIVETSTTQNFFLVTNNNGAMYEIHLAGYEPTGFYNTYEADKDKSASGVAVAKSSTKYESADGNVWGFKTPVLVKHATERTNFGVSYPEFTPWIKTKNEEYNRWYEKIGLEKDGQSLIIPW